MPSRGRHQSTSKACKAVLDRVESLPGVRGVILGHSYGGKSLGRHGSTGALRIQRPAENGFKGVIQTSKGLQELFILVEPGAEEQVRAAVEAL